MSRFRFNPSLSFDGVAILIALFGGALWLGQLSQKVEQHDSRISAAESTLTEISRTQSTLAAIVDERTRKANQ